MVLFIWTCACPMAGGQQATIENKFLSPGKFGGILRPFATDFHISYVVVLSLLVLLTFFHVFWSCCFMWFKISSGYAELKPDQ